MSETFTTADCKAACIAMREWFKSQGLKPGESMAVIAMFCAGMIKTQNPTDPLKQLGHLALLEETILNFWLTQ